jgi:hypothetical protein
MRTLLFSMFFVGLGVSGIVACGSDNTGTTGSAATDGGTSASGGGAGKSCYLKTDLLKCECADGNADAAHPTSEWSKVLNCSDDTLDNAAHCSGASAPCTCDVLHCEIVTGSFCGCGTRTWTDVEPEAEMAELTTCTSFEWCCESADKSACHCGNGTPACAAGFTQTTAPACSANDRLVPSGKTDACGQ